MMPKVYKSLADSNRAPSKLPQSTIHTKYIIVKCTTLHNVCSLVQN